MAHSMEGARALSILFLSVQPPSHFTWTYCTLQQYTYSFPYWITTTVNLFTFFFSFIFCLVGCLVVGTILARPKSCNNQLQVATRYCTRYICIHHIHTLWERERVWCILLIALLSPSLSFSIMNYTANTAHSMKYYDTSTISLQQLKGKGGRKGGFTRRSLVRRLVPWTLQKERTKKKRLS